MDAAQAGYRGPVQDRGPVVFAVTVATLVLASAFVASRMVCRYFIVKRITWDDLLMVLAWFFAFFLSLTICLGVANGLGKHDRDIDIEQVPVLRRCEYVFSILYNPALMATKTSILIFYLRLASDTQIVLRVVSWATLAVVNVAGFILTFMNVFQCRPTQAAWNADFMGATTCIPLLTEFICAAPVNIVTDLAILALPIPVLTGMSLPSRQKNILVLTFTLGVFVTVVDVIRIYYLQQAIVDDPIGGRDSTSSFGGQVDFAYNASISLMWSAVEANVGMTCACIPVLKPLVIRLLPSILTGPDATKRPRSNRQSLQMANPAAPTPQHKPRQDSESNASSNGPSAPAHLETVHHAEHRGSHPRDETHELFLPPHNVSFITTGPAIVFRESSFDPPSARPRLDTGPLTTSTESSLQNRVYFGFVKMKKPSRLLDANTKESLKYCTIVSILFILWGVSYGLLSSLNRAVADLAGMGTAEALGLTSAYFGGGYFFGPLLVGEWLLRRDEHNRSRRNRENDQDNIGGFKVTFIVGLCIYGIGTIIFWPSAVTASYGGFMLSNFVAGFGLSVLEVPANSFMVLCGPPEYGEARLLIAQAFQAAGSVLSSLLAEKVFFRSLDPSGKDGTQTLLNVQWTYLGITLLCVVLALFFYYVPLPEVADQELEEAATHLPLDPCKKSIGGLQLRTVSLILAVLSQYVYVGSQEANIAFLRTLLVAVLPGQPKGGLRAAGGTLLGANAFESSRRPQGFAIAIADSLIVGRTAFAISRVICGYLAYLSVKNPRVPKPRIVLGISVVVCLALALVLTLLRSSDPNTLFIIDVLYFFFEGPIWPLLFAFGLHGQGRRTKRAAAFITMGASGPAFIPYIMYGIIVTGGRVQSAFLVLVVISVLMLLYPIFLTFVKDARLLLGDD
ncbi:L-fucose-proton symporter [Escovopsis weberi]|uniref:L-fucose-proton symporter n=1 Tax=Escovopsis weberi TaxID=150374 RepID=A0A0M8N0G3_ESCWE|nr:L-fucose-proton symporter [Escovopsis weberi]